jgi:hypothetical protein
VNLYICVPMNVAKIGGAQYFVTFIDDFIRKTWVAFFKEKSDIFKSLRILLLWWRCKLVERQNP